MLISTDLATSYKTVKDLINAHSLTLVGDESAAYKLVAHEAAMAEASALPVATPSDLVVAAAHNTVVCFSCGGVGHYANFSPTPSVVVVDMLG